MWDPEFVQPVPAAGGRAALTATQGTLVSATVGRDMQGPLGAFALAIAFRAHPELLIGARLGSPLVVGYGEGETYLGSDALALAPDARAQDQGAQRLVRQAMTSIGDGVFQAGAVRTGARPPRLIPRRWKDDHA